MSIVLLNDETQTTTQFVYHKHKYPNMDIILIKKRILLART